MSWPIRFLRDAKAEYDDASGRFEALKHGFGFEFLHEVGLVLDRISEMPKIYQTAHGAIRRATVRRFPNSVYLRESGDEVIVVAVFNDWRDPKEWLKRTRKNH